MSSEFTGAYLLRRIGQGVGVLVATFTLTFLLLQVMPGDSVTIRFENPELGLSPEEIAQLREAYGADQGVISQFFSTLTAFARGDFGYSFSLGTPVKDLLAHALPDTLRLAGLAFGAALVLAGVIAVLSSTTSFGWLRHWVASLPSLFVAIPVFWLGIMLVQIFSFQLGWIPIINPSPTQGLILPVATLAVPIAAPIAQVFIRSMQEVLQAPFITVVRAKGASQSWVLWRNVMRNALLPTLTMAGVLFGELIGGAVVTETIFGRNGIGRIAQQAVHDQDTMVLQAIVVLTAASFVVLTLIVDVLYPLLDPRLRRARS